VRPALLLAAVLVVAQVTASEADSAPPLRVVTFNLFHGGASSGLTGDDASLEERLQMVLRELRALRPDVVALQEASWGRRRGLVAARLAEGLGLHYAFEAASPRVMPLLGTIATWIMNFREGSAVLSRFPIVARDVTDLPRCNRYLDPRIMLHAEIDTPWGRLDVASAHPARADCQLQRIADVARSWPADRPGIVMGDLNTWETAPGLGVFGAAGLVDAFRLANPDGDGATVRQVIDSQFRTASRRIDYVFLRSAPGRPWRVLASRIILNQPARHDDGTTLWPSDHYGVLADLELAPVQ